MKPDGYGFNHTVSSPVTYTRVAHRNNDITLIHDSNNQLNLTIQQIQDLQLKAQFNTQHHAGFSNRKPAHDQAESEDYP